jgi:PIN domain nuclease of toxin-antitoxin system
VILLDTHTVVWTSTDKRQLSVSAAEAIREESRAAGGVAVASSSLWEIAMMSSKGRFVLPRPLSEYLRYIESMYVVLPITGAIAERAMQFTNMFPNDPTDRLIAATAVVHHIKLVTKDKPIRLSQQVDCIW